MNFSSNKGIFPTNPVIKQPVCFSRMRTSQNFDVICKSISIFLYRSLFFFAFLLYQQFFAHFIVFFLYRIVASQHFREEKKSSRSDKPPHWQWIFPQNVIFSVSRTLLGLVRIFKTRYRQKLFLTLLLVQRSSAREARLRSTMGKLIYPSQKIW